MSKNATGYCAACDLQVRGKSGAADDTLGPDGCLYCNECMRLLKLLHEQRHPEGGGLFAPAAKSGKSSPRPRGGGPSRAAEARAGTPAPSRTVLFSICAVLLAGVCAWFLRPAETPRPAKHTEANIPPAPDNAKPPDDPVKVVPTPTPQPEPQKAGNDVPTGHEDPLAGNDAPVKPPPDPEPAPKNDPPTPPAAGDVLAADDLATIRAAVGKTRTVEGAVTRAAPAKSGKVFYIVFGKDKDAFQGVIFQRHLAEFEKKFGDLAHGLTGKTVRVHGPLSVYQDRVQIVLDEISQLEIK